MDPDDLAKVLLDHVRQHAALIYLVVDPDGTIREANNYARDLMGDLTGRNLTDILIDFDGSFQLSRVLADNTTPHLINIPTHSGLPQTYYFRFIAIGTVILVIGEVNSLEVEELRVSLVDTNNRINTLVRELHQKNAELTRAREKADTANRAKSNFLSVMSHEIRTPLNAVIGIGRFLRDTPLDPGQEEFLGNLLEAAESLLGIITDILDFSRIEADRLELAAEPFVLSHLFHGVVGPLKYLARKKGLLLSLDLAPDIPNLLMGDSIRLRQIITNLVGNAIKFTQRGEVVVTVSGSALADGHPEAGSPPCWQLVFSVRDTGIGIPPDRQEHIFESFTQAEAGTTRRYGGTGLGLAIARRLIDKMGGAITVQSAVGFGSCFTVAIPFPVVAEPVGEAQDSAATPEVPIIRPLTILLADDHEINRRYMYEILARQGHRVTAVSSGSEILEALPRRSYDLVLTDITMPGMDGIEAARRIRSSLGAGFDPEIPIIALTAASLAELRGELDDAGFNGYVGKPVDFDQLVRSIGQTVPGAVIASGGTLSSPAVAVLAEPPVFDREYQMRHFQGEQAFLVELLEIFTRELPGKLAEIEQGLANHTYDHVKVVAHALKGSAATVGAVALAQWSNNIGNAARTADLTAMRNGLERLQIEVERLRRELSTDSCGAWPG